MQCKYAFHFSDGAVISGSAWNSHTSRRRTCPSAGKKKEYESYVTLTSSALCVNEWSSKSYDLINGPT